MEEISITESEVIFPVLVIPKRCTKLETNCEATDNVLIYVNITSYDTERTEASIYSGFCNIKLVDNYDLNVLSVDENSQVPDFNSNPVPIVVPDASNQGLYPFDHQSQVWIDPTRSPYVHNSYGAVEAQKRYSIYQHKTHTGHITVEQHNTYITQNVYNYNEHTEYTASEESEQKKITKNLLNDANQQINIDMDLDEDLQCAVFLSQLPEENTNVDLNRARGELKYLKLQSENNALKQLMSSDIQSISKQQKTIFFGGHDTPYGQTIQNIALNDPTMKCMDNGIDNEVVIDQPSSEPNPKKYQCDKCKKIFLQITAFKEHIRGTHTNTRSTRLSRKNVDTTFMCAKCGKVLKDQSKLEVHSLGHGDPNVECITCKKVFASKFTLRNHLKLHQRKQQCYYCKRSYHNSEDLIAHLERIHFIFKCTSCDYTAHTSLELMTHTRSHTDLEFKGDSEVTLSTENDQIKESDSTSRSPPELVIDTYYEDGMAKLQDIQEANSVIAKVMSNEIFLLNAKKAREHKSTKSCDVCRKKFDRVGDLKRHLIEHIIRSTLAKTPVNANGTLTIHCEVCRVETFSRVDRYKEHLREHAKLTIYKCICCDKSFSDSSNFSKHKKIHGTKFLKCDLCERKFNSKKMIARHMEYHIKNSPIKCSYCRKDFHFASMLKKHVKHAHTRAHTLAKCRFCQQQFKTLKEKWDHEWIIHSVRKIIVDCVLCGFKFRKYSELKRHCKDVHDTTIPPATKLLKDRKAF